MFIRDCMYKVWGCNFLQLFWGEGVGTLFNDGKREEFLLLGSIRMDDFDLKIQKLLQKTENDCDKYFSNCFMNGVIVAAIGLLTLTVKNSHTQSSLRGLFHISCFVKLHYHTFLITLISP